MKQIHLLFFLLVALYACQTENQQSIIPVEAIGTLRQIMHEGDISAKVDLETLTNRPYLYGLGAAENLKGEILIWKGEAYLTTVAGSGLATYDGFRKKASLLVYSEVEKWDSIVLPATISELNDLENFVIESATKANIDTTVAFPFLIKGQPATLNWHVIDWDPNDTVHTHEKHKKSGMRSGWKNMPTEVLGFYGPEPGIFTHMNSKLHLHATTPDRRLVAHLDDVVGIAGMTLFLPKIEKETAQ